MANEWTKDWPNEVGYFWFYGYRYGKISCGRKCKPELMLVEVWRGSNSLIHVANGQFMFESEVEEALFQKAVLPELPKERNYD